MISGLLFAGAMVALVLGTLLAGWFASYMVARWLKVPNDSAGAALVFGGVAFMVGFGTGVALMVPYDSFGVGYFSFFVALGAAATVLGVVLMYRSRKAPSGDVTTGEAPTAETPSISTSGV